jgi:hypothetical protein
MVTGLYCYQVRDGQQIAPGRQICEVLATLLAAPGGMNERTDSRRLYQLNDRYWQAVVA